MGVKVLSCLVFLGLLGFISAQRNIFCYYGSWATYRQGNGKFDVNDIDPTLCSHIIYSFIGINGWDASIRVLDPWIDLPDNGGLGYITKFSQFKNAKNKPKVMVAVGGWNEGSTGFSMVARDQAKREKFADEVVQFLQRHNLDGLDIDWEYPGQRDGSSYEDVQNYNLFLQTLKTKFQPHNYILTASVSATEESASKYYDVSEIAKILDFVLIMTYDYHGAWDSVTGLNAPLYTAKSDPRPMLNIDSSIKYWLSKGTPLQKLVLGMPFYGRTFVLSDASQNHVRASMVGPGPAAPYTQDNGLIGYNEFVERISNGQWTRVWDKEQLAPYAYNGRDWISYDDAESIGYKAEYILNNRLGGAMIWSLETDDFRGIGGNGTYPLLRKINQVFKR